MKYRYIGLMVADTPALPLGLLGILKSGSTVVPLNPGFPVERIHFIINDCHIEVMVTDDINYPAAEAIARNSPVIRYLLCIDSAVLKVTKTQHYTKKTPAKKSPTHQEYGRINDSDQRCYVIYTSGSTGQPKGVPITHRNLGPLLQWFGNYFELGRHTSVLHNLSYTFDFGMFEILTTLGFGGRLHLVDSNSIGDMAGYRDYIVNRSLNTLHTTPAFLSHMTAPGKPMPTLEILHLGGEKLSGEIIGQVSGLLPRQCKIYNGYGPTEATINCSIFCITPRLRATAAGWENIPIGKPSHRHKLYIVNNYFRPVPIGAAGELYVEGEGVAAGYLNRPELTAERFCLGRPGGLFLKKPPPWTPRKNVLLVTSPVTRHPSRFYKTGDLVRWLPDGNIEFLGRIDHQVKIRGFRIELGEIEDCLLKNENLKEAVVLQLESPVSGISGQGSRRQFLCAYIVLAPGKSKTGLTVTGLRVHLSRFLPDYMIPAYFVIMAGMPLTGSGKVDRKSLPYPDHRALDSATAYAAPRNETEAQLIRLWQTILPGKNQTKIGIYDDFFELGGDSLTAHQFIAHLREQFKVEIPLRTFFEQPVIEAIAREVAAREKAAIAIKRAPPGVVIPLSFAQERLWFLQQLDQHSTAYFVPRIVRLKGKLDPGPVERSFAEILRRHEILRTVFPTRDGRPEQRVLPHTPFKLPVIDLLHLDEEHQTREVNQWLKEEGQRPFDFEKGPMIRVTLLKLKPAEHLLVTTEHHLVHDGWTQGVLLGEFIALFTAYSQGKPSPLPPLPIQYGDFAYWQRNYLQGEVLERDLDYWKGKLTGLPPLLELPTDRPRPPEISGKGGVATSNLPIRLSQLLGEFSRKRNVTLFMTMLAVFKLLLYRYSGQEDFCVGAGIANRRFKEMEGMLGMVIDTLALRTELSGDLTFAEFLSRVKKTCLEAYEHEDTPFEKVVEAIQPQRSLSYTPIFQFMFTFMDTPSQEFVLPGLEVIVEPSHNQSAKFDLNVIVSTPHQDRPGEISISWEYNSDIFDASTITRMMGHYYRLLEAITREPESHLAALPMQEASEMEQILYQWNETAAPYPEHKTLYQLVAEQVEKTPDHVALAFIQDQLTYRQLELQARQTVRELMTAGLTRGAVVGIGVKHSLEMVVGVLGILKAGGVYLPIEPESPQERIDYMLKDSNAQLFLTAAAIASFSQGRTLNIPSSPPAYLIYTSGSTGKPKGVLVEHRGVVNYLSWARKFYVADRPYDFPLYSSLAFDLTVTSLYVPLISGNKVVVYPPQSGEIEPVINKILRDDRVQAIKLTPTHLKMVTGADAAASRLKCLIVGGEELRTALAFEIREKFKREIEIYNEYGPTETVVGCMIYRYNPETDTADGVPIGVPVANVQVYLLDSSQNPVPIGISGEIYVSGAGVARGYLNRPGLTAERFCLRRPGGLFLKKPPPWTPRKNVLLDPSPLTKKPARRAPSLTLATNTNTLYKTGDLARWLVNGNLEFLGRKDRQVKIRGHRIEIGEIENRLQQYAPVKEAVVVTRKDANEEQHLCAYILLFSRIRPGENFQAGLRSHLAVSLPQYMIPSYFVTLDKVPLTTNGKLDINALPEPAQASPGPPGKPQNRIEAELMKIWGQVLFPQQSHPPMDIDTNFFASGGHSLKAIDMVTLVHQNLDARVPLAQVFKTPTIKGLALYIQETAPDKFIALQPLEKKEYYPLSSAQKRLYTLQQVDPDNTGYNLPAIFPLDKELTREKIQQTLRKLIERHESLRTSYKIKAGEPVQYVHDEVEFNLHAWGLNHPNPGEPVNDFIRPFDLAQAPLLRVGWLDNGTKTGTLLVDMHHIISDGISQAILQQDFTALYDGTPLPALAIQYKEYAQWQKKRKTSPALHRQQQFWLKEFAGNITVLELPTDFPRPPLKSYSGSHLEFVLEENELQGLKSLAARAEATLYMAILSLFNVLLWKLSGNEDIVVGTPVAGRVRADLQQVIGMFVNTLALRNFPSPDKTFNRLLQEVKKNVVNAFENQEYQFEDLAAQLPIPRDPSRNPLFDTVLVLQNLQEAPERRDQHTGDPEYEFERGTAKFDLTLTARESGKKLALVFEFNTKLFKESKIKRFSRFLREIAAAVSADPEIQLKNIAVAYEFADAGKKVTYENFNFSG